MSSKMDMALDDVISSNKSSRRSNTSYSSSSPRKHSKPYDRRSSRHNNNNNNGRRHHRPSSSNADDGPWKHDLYDSDPDNNEPGVTRKIKVSKEVRKPEEAMVIDYCHLRIKNLHWEVSDDDLLELFEQEGVLGEISRLRVLYDNAGRSEGIAEITVSNPELGILIQQKYHGVSLDGQAITIEFVPVRKTIAPATTTTNISISLRNEPKSVSVLDRLGKASIATKSSKKKSSGDINSRLSFPEAHNTTSLAQQHRAKQQQQQNGNVFSRLGPKAPEAPIDGGVIHLRPSGYGYPSHLLQYQQYPQQQHQQQQQAPQPAPTRPKTKAELDLEMILYMEGQSFPDATAQNSSVDMIRNAKDGNITMVVDGDEDGEIIEQTANAVNMVAGGRAVVTYDDVVPTGGDIL